MREAKYRVYDPDGVYAPVTVQAPFAVEIPHLSPLTVLPHNEAAVKSHAIAKMYGCPLREVDLQHVADMFETVEIDLLELPLEMELAHAFAVRLCRELGRKTMEQVNFDNIRSGNPNVCHSHDHCDANMVMLDAWLSTTGREPRMAQEDDDYWNSAWSYAKARGFWVEHMPWDSLERK